MTRVVLAALAGRPDLDPMLAPLTLPVRKEPDLRPCAQRILALRPDLIELLLPIRSERFQGLSTSQIMATLGISKDFWRHTRVFKTSSRKDGRKAAAERLARSPCAHWNAFGSLAPQTSSGIKALSLPQLEELEP